MKKWLMIMLCLSCYVGMLSLTGCGGKKLDPAEEPVVEGEEEPPAEEPPADEPKDEGGGEEK